MICSRLKTTDGLVRNARKIPNSIAVRRSGVPANAATCCSGSTESPPWESAAVVCVRPAHGRAAQNDIHPRDEFARAERLCDIIVATDLEAEHPVDLVVARRKKQDRHIGGFS